MQDKRILGRIEEVFGKVEQPSYSTTLKEGIPTDLPKGTQVWVVPDHANIIYDASIYEGRGILLRIVSTPEAHRGRTGRIEDRGRGAHRGRIGRLGGAIGGTGRRIAGGGGGARGEFV